MARASRECSVELSGSETDRGSIQLSMTETFPGHLAPTTGLYDSDF